LASSLEGGVHTDGDGDQREVKDGDSPQSVTVSVVDAVRSDDPDINSINPERPNGSVSRICDLTAQSKFVFLQI
jgi:hypothetical protein